MLRFLRLFLFLAFMSEVLSLEGSCGVEREPEPAEGAAGCGCDKLKRASGGTTEPAGKYSSSFNGGASEARGEENQVQSQVWTHVCKHGSSDACFGFQVWGWDHSEHTMSKSKTNTTKLGKILLFWKDKGCNELLNFILSIFKNTL